MTALLVGIDVGGTKVACALAERGGTILRRARRPTAPSGDPARDVARLVDDVRGLLAEEGARIDDVAAIGISVPGPFDPERGLVLNPPNLPGWGEVPVVRPMETTLGRPVGLENDANAAALAEWRHGAGRGFRDLAYLTMSTGIGGGLILGGRLHRGKGANAGEVGHVPVEWNGDPCHCGLHGCLEAYAGGAAWAERLQRVTPAGSRVAALAGDAGAARPEHVIAAAEEGDAFALAEVERFNTYLARGIVQLTFTVAPEVVVLGTIPTAAGEALCLEPVRALVRSHAWPLLVEGLEIVPAALGEELPYRAGVCVAEEMLATA